MIWNCMRAAAAIVLDIMVLDDEPVGFAPVIDGTAQVGVQVVPERGEHVVGLAELGIPVLV